MEEAKKVKSESDRNGWETRVNGWRVLKHGVNVCTLADMSSPLLVGLETFPTGILYTRSVRNKTSWPILLMII